MKDSPRGGSNTEKTKELYGAYLSADEPRQTSKFNSPPEARSDRYVLHIKILLELWSPSQQAFLLIHLPHR